MLKLHENKLYCTYDGIYDLVIRSSKLIVGIRCSSWSLWKSLKLITYLLFLQNNCGNLQTVHRRLIGLQFITWVSCFWNLWQLN